jgi:hypothetical protein
LHRDYLVLFSTLSPFTSPFFYRADKVFLAKNVDKNNIWLSRAEKISAEEMYNMAAGARGGEFEGDVAANEAGTRCV